MGESAPKDASIKLHVLSQEEITKQNIEAEQLWFILLSNGPVGPFHFDELRNFLLNNPQFPKETKVSNFKDKKWTLLKEVKELYEENGQGKSIFVLVNGQKEGPYTLEEIKIKVEEKSILFDDLISNDKGKTWIKVKDHHHLHVEEWGETKMMRLPFLPKEDLFESEENDLSQIKDQTSTSVNNNEFLINLVQMGKSSAQGTINDPNSHRRSSDPDQIISSRGPQKSYKFVWITFMAIVLVVVFLNVFDIKKFDTLSTLENRIKSLKKEKISKNIGPKSISTKVSPRKTTPKSFFKKKTKTYTKPIPKTPQKREVGRENIKQRRRMEDNRERIDQKIKPIRTRDRANVDDNYYPEENNYEDNYENANRSDGPQKIDSRVKRDIKSNEQELIDDFENLNERFGDNRDTSELEIDNLEDPNYDYPPEEFQEAPYEGEEQGLDAYEQQDPYY